MISILLLASALSAPLQADQLPQAGALISKMMGRYASAKTLVGTIQSTFNSGEGTVKVSTLLQFDRAKRLLYIRQNKETGKKGSHVAICDGKYLMYTNPLEGREHRDKKPYLVEPASRKEATLTSVGPKVREIPLDLGEIYVVTSMGLADASVPMDMAIARPGDLEQFRSQLISFKTQEQTTFSGKQAYRISGLWSDTTLDDPRGNYDLYLTAEGDILGYVTTEQVNYQGRIHKIVSSWVSDLKVDAEPDPKLFALKR